MPRIHCPDTLSAGVGLSLPAGAARHVQVLRMQPGEGVTLFDGRGGQWQATITRMGRSEVQVEVGAHEPIEREAARAVWLAPGMPANERMDWLVEKATELGVASITPLLAERSVLKLKGERADKKRAHWQGVAVAAAEQCGRNRVPLLHAALDLSDWLSRPTAEGVRCMLSLAQGTRSLSAAAAGAAPLVVLSGPEGGLSPAEEALALSSGFVPVTLGSRVLRAETAPLAVLAALSV